MLPVHFRKLTVQERIAVLKRECGYDPTPLQAADAETMIESAVGYSSIPLGVAPRILVNGRWHAVPMATEEPSVVAAQMFAAAIVARHGGVRSTGGRAIGTGQVFVQHCDRRMYKKITAARGQLRGILEASCASLRARGGGPIGSELHWQRLRGGGQRRVAVFEFTVDTVDAMGANRIISIAESIAQWMRRELHADVLMAILSNDLSHTPSTAEFLLPLSALRSAASAPMGAARNIVAAAAVAEANRKRALTHNKGIMNGICALATATGNDSRAVEAAAHGYASDSGRYRPLSRYAISDGVLCGRLALPLPLATVGGATETQHHARQGLAILNVRNAIELKEVAAAVGLQQNFAALLALTSGGIARGHMPLQRRRGTAR